MKKILLVALALLVLTMSVAAAEGEIKIGQVQYAAHGTKCFAVMTVAMQGDVIADAYIDEYQFMATGSVGVPNSESDFGTAYPEGKVLASKKVNADAYSENMAKAGSTVVPVSKVSFGFVAGGGEYGGKAPQEGYPFAGGAGAGVSLQPVGFLVCGDDHVRMLPAQTTTSLDRVIDMLPGFFEEVKKALCKDKGSETVSE